MQTLPIQIPKLFFKQLQSMLFGFIWENKAHRLKIDIMWCSKRNGGLAVPDIYRYYLDIHLNRVIDWCVPAQNKQWVEVKQSFVGLLLRGLPWLDQYQTIELGDHPTIVPTLKLVKKIFKDPPISPHVLHQCTTFLETHNFYLE